ncbi:MAG: 2-(1,2-epoxy-1,2-dihydrophenyl)acetyl-CoA isomerase [Halieaceae bacterium]|jgi:2-(1,2-epoxy-1,2-dihydrophenyl)acetyl-CoA isomerase|nr:2-(1,2-epoxy-1,2-dihydrophenyl)acetyl-CoA isomerase [Halieaceae bacterium]
MTDKLQAEQEDGVLTLTLNRPDRLNAIDFELLDALTEALENAAGDVDVGAIVLAGAGRVFCAGADIGQMVDRTPAEWEQIVDHYLDPIRAISRIEKPVIARCHGDVVGGGLGLALACDFRVGAEGSRYCAPFVNLALAGCDMSAGYFLPRLVGMGRATDMMMTARFVEAQEAKEMGLLSRLVPELALDDAVNGLARSLACGPSRALAFTKNAIRRSVDCDMNTEFDYEIFAQVQCLQSEAHNERVAAFLARASRK